MSSTAEASRKFWPWFQANGDRLFAQMYGQDPGPRERAFEELQEAFGPDQSGGLRIELAPGDGGVKDLVVSADGQRERVDLVKEFVDAAPPLDGWRVVAFRSRLPIHEGLAINIQGEEVSPDDVWFTAADGEDGIDLALFVRGLTEDNERMRGLGAALLTEHALGERDTFTLLGSLDIQPLPDEPDGEGRRPFAELVATFDAVKQQKYPPPGALPLDLESDWAMIEGTADGQPIFGRVSLALRAVMGHPAYDRSLTVRVPFNETRPDGLPGSAEEFDLTTDISDDIRDVLEQQQQSLLAVSLVGRGRREMIFYTSDPQGALLRLDDFRGGLTSHAVEAEVERDTFWGVYGTFTSANEDDEEEGEDAEE